MKIGEVLYNKLEALPFFKKPVLMENNNTYQIIYELTENEEIEDLQKKVNEESRKRVWENLNKILQQMEKGIHNSNEVLEIKQIYPKKYFSWNLDLDKV